MQLIIGACERETDPRALLDRRANRLRQADAAGDFRFFVDDVMALLTPAGAGRAWRGFVVRTVTGIVDTAAMEPLRTLGVVLTGTPLVRAKLTELELIERERAWLNTEDDNA